MLIESASWAVTLARFNIAFATSLLSRFSVQPRQGHLEVTLHIFGYLKKNPNRGILMDSCPLQFLDNDLLKSSFHPNFLEDYEYATEGIDPDLP